MLRSDPPAANLVREHKARGLLRFLEFTLAPCAQLAMTGSLLFVRKRSKRISVLEFVTGMT